MLTFLSSSLWVFEIGGRRELPSGCQHFQGFFFRLKDLEDFNQTRDVEDLFDLRIGAHQKNSAAVLSDFFECSDQNTESGTIDVSDFLKIDQKLVVLVLNQFVDGLLDTGGGVNIDLALNLYGLGLTIKVTGTNFNIHKILLL